MTSEWLWQAVLQQEQNMNKQADAELLSNLLTHLADRLGSAADFWDEELTTTEITTGELAEVLAAAKKLDALVERFVDTGCAADSHGHDHEVVLSAHAFTCAADDVEEAIGGAR